MSDDFPNHWERYGRSGAASSGHIHPHASASLQLSLSFFDRRGLYLQWRRWARVWAEAAAPASQIGRYQMESSCLARFWDSFYDAMVHVASMALELKRHLGNCFSEKGTKPGRGVSNSLFNIIPPSLKSMEPTTRERCLERTPQPDLRSIFEEQQNGYSRRSLETTWTIAWQNLSQ